MQIKVNRVSTSTEANTLIELGVNILSFSIDSRCEKPTKDSRAISLKKLESILVEIQNPNIQFSLNFNYYAPFSLKEQEEIVKQLGINYIEFFSDTFFSKIYEKSLNNDTDFILYGDDLGYDTPWFNYSKILSLPKKPSLITLETESIVEGNWGYFKSEEKIGRKQNETSDVLLNSVQSMFSKLKILVSDSYNLSSIKNDLEKVYASGINFSLKSLANDMFSKSEELSYLSEQSSYYYSLKDIQKHITELKK